jgi:hypothetical protein
VLRLNSSAAAATAAISSHYHCATDHYYYCSYTVCNRYSLLLTLTSHHHYYYTILHIHSVHTGGADSVEVPVGHWFNLELLTQSLPVPLQLWSEFEQNCGRPGILDGFGTVTVEPQSADLAGDSPYL